jgi:NADPH:quinone reductase
MKAIRVAKYGGPEELQLQEVAQPKPGAGEALVRVHAAGVNYADIYFRNGSLTRPIPFPFTLGLEGAGEIEAVGEGVSELKRGRDLCKPLGFRRQYHSCNPHHSALGQMI